MILTVVKTLILIALPFTYRKAFTYGRYSEVKLVLDSFNQIVEGNGFKGNQDSNVLNRLFIYNDNSYCSRSNAYKFYHPEVILEDTYSLYERKNLPRRILRENTFESIPALHHIAKPIQAPPKFRMPLALSQLYPYYGYIYSNFVTGKGSLCLFQKYNHMPGKKQLSLKQKLMDNFYEQIDHLRKNNFSQECITNATYIPETFRLFNKQDCQIFFQEVGTPEFMALTERAGPQYINKLGNEVHRGRGITVLFPKQLQETIEEYGNGTKCGLIRTPIVAQRYISNPYLYKNHKIEFRIYWFITTTNPLIVYTYQRPLIKRCAKPFDLNSTVKAAHVCNTAIVKKNLKYLEELDGEEYDEDVIEHEEFFIDWNFEGLQERLLEEKKINNTNWLEEYLYPLVHTKLIHLTRSAQAKFKKDSRFGEFFATDFILSDDLKVYVLETNYNPQILSVTPDRILRNYKMIMDTIEIQNAYLRSRFMRLQKIARQLLNKYSDKRLKEKLKSPEVQQNVLEAYKDRLDQGIQISEDNLYRKIIDENFEAEAAYGNLVQKQCFY